MPIANERLASRVFLANMYADGYFPHALVDKGKQILVQLCERIEAARPTTLSELYALTHAATEQFNDLEAEFEDAGSELETEARAAICEEFREIASGYGFEADPDQLVAPRNW